MIDRALVVLHSRWPLNKRAKNDSCCSSVQMLEEFLPLNTCWSDDTRSGDLTTSQTRHILYTQRKTFCFQKYSEKSGCLSHICVQIINVHFTPSKEYTKLKTGCKWYLWHVVEYHKNLFKKKMLLSYKSIKQSFRTQSSKWAFRLFFNIHKKMKCFLSIKSAY